MAAVGEAVKANQDAERRLRVFVSAEDATIRRRIVAALSDQGPHLALQSCVVDDEQGSDPAAASTSIMVLACDIGRRQGMAELRRLHRESRQLAIVVVSPPGTATDVRRALDAGADAVIFEPALESTLAVAVSAVDSGQSVVPRELRASVEKPVLSHRERQVLTYVTRGLTNAQIALRLFLSESTVKSHLSSSFTKLGVRSRQEAAAMFRALEIPNAEDRVDAPPAKAVAERTSP